MPYLYHFLKLIVQFDMKKHFDTHYKLNQVKFSLERDGHWNKTAHELVEKNISKLQTS